MSLSARRAWIEMVSYQYLSQDFWRVALRKESVDRNFTTRTKTPIGCVSLSARRAWIEIIDYIIEYVNDASLSARRAWIEIIGLTYDGLIASGRSPQGERG